MFDWTVFTVFCPLPLLDPFPHFTLTSVSTWLLFHPHPFSSSPLFHPRPYFTFTLVWPSPLFPFHPLRLSLLRITRYPFQVYFQADLLNSEIGSAFNSAYTLQRHRDDVSCTSGRDSRASVQSVQSVRSVRDRSQSQPDRDIATPSGSLRNEILKDRRDRSRSDHRYVYDYDSEDFGWVKFLKFLKNFDFRKFYDQVIAVRSWANENGVFWIKCIFLKYHNRGGPTA